MGMLSSWPSLSLDGSDKSEVGSSLKSLAVEMLISMTDACCGEPSWFVWSNDPFGLNEVVFISISVRLKKKSWITK